MKVVANRCYGGFSISIECARRMAELGCKTAQAEIDEYDGKISGSIPLEDIESKFILFIIS